MNFCKQTIHPPEALQLQQQKRASIKFCRPVCVQQDPSQRQRSSSNHSTASDCLTPQLYRYVYFHSPEEQGPAHKRTTQDITG